MDGEGGVVDRRHACRKAWPTGVVAIFVPPAVLQEVQTIFDSPMLANMPQKIGGGYLLGIEAAHIVARVMQHDFAIVSTQFTIHTQTNLATRQIKRLANVICVV